MELIDIEMDSGMLARVDIFQRDYPIIIYQDKIYEGTYYDSHSSLLYSIIEGEAIDYEDVDDEYMEKLEQSMELIIECYSIFTYKGIKYIDAICLDSIERSGKILLDYISSNGLILIHLFIDENYKCKPKRVIL